MRDLPRSIHLGHDLGVGQDCYADRIRIGARQDWLTYADESSGVGLESPTYGFPRASIRFFAVVAAGVSANSLTIRL